MGGAIKRTVLVPLIPIDIWYSHHGCERNRGERERDGDGESSPGIRDQKARMLKQPYPTTCSGYFLRRGMMA